MVACSDARWNVRAALHAVFALCAAVMLAVGVQPVAMAQQQVFDSGHVDVFNVTAAGGGLSLDLKEDITGNRVAHDPESVELRVKEDAYRALSGPFAQFGSHGYVLPLVEQQGLLWPGWDTQGVKAGGFNSVDLVFDRVTGPGRIYLATSAGGFDSGIAPLLNQGFELASGSVLTQAQPAHVHAYWVFSAPGTYELSVYAAAGGVTSNTANYTFVVGDGTASSTETGNESTSGDEKSTDSQKDSTDDSKKDEKKEAPKRTTSTSTGFPGMNGFDPLSDRWLNSDAPSVWGAPVAEKTTQSSTARAGATTSVTAPAQQGSAAAGANAPAAAGTTSAAHAPRCHAVNETVAGGGLQSMVRDDRTSPATVVASNSLVFHLSEAATATPQQALGLIPAGQKVYMIGSTQVPGVPWLGANTMDPALLDNTTGAVTWALTSMTGPGAVEVFTSGNFGQVIGERWFSGTQGATEGVVEIPRNTHVHPNWVFSAPGRYELVITQQAYATDGTLVEAATPLIFDVGVGGGVTDGHFDVGATYATGTTTRTVYVDDAGQPCDPAQGTTVAAAGGNSGTTAGGTQAAGTTRKSAAATGGQLSSTGVSRIVFALMVAAFGVAVFGASLMLRGRRL